MSETLQIAEETPNIEEMERADVPAIFNAFKPEVEKLRQTALTVTVTSASDKQGMAIARATRLALRVIRIAVEKRRVELKDASLRRGKRVDAAAKEVIEPIEALEKRLAEQEEFAIRETMRIEDETRRARQAELSPYPTRALSVDLGKITPEEYGSILAGMKAVHEAKLETARKAEEARAAKEKAEAEERERIRLENARLKKEAEEKEAALAVERARVAEERMKEQAEAERKAEEARKAADAEKARLKKEADAKLKAQQEKADAERRKAEEAAKLERERLQTEADARQAKEAEARAIAERNAKEEAAARKKLEDEKRAREEAEAKAAKAAADKAKRDAAAPDAEKLTVWVKQLQDIKFPRLSPACAALDRTIFNQFKDFCGLVEVAAARLLGEGGAQ